MKIKKKYIVILCAVVLIAIAGISMFFARQDGVSKEYKVLAEEYTALRAENDPAAYDLCYFKPGHEMLREVMIRDVRISGAKVLRYEKINDSLLAFFVRYDEKNGYSEGYSFISVIDGKPYISMNEGEIPDALKEGMDEEKYSVKYENGEIVDPDRILEFSNVRLME